MFLNRAREAAWQQIETDHLHEEMLEELMESKDDDYEDFQTDKEKAIDATLSVMAELDKFAEATTDLNIDHKWLSETIRTVRMFRVELDLRVKGYVNLHPLDQDRLQADYEQRRQDMIDDPSQWRE